MALLDATTLRKTYPASDGQPLRVLDDIDLQVEPGEVVALLGASGSGKTTLLNLLSGIDRPDSGTVRIAGQDVHALAEPARTLLRRRHVGFVFQFFNLIPTLSVAENIALPLELLGHPADRQQRRADELLEAVGLTGLGPRYPETLSGGQQQRVAIARALAHRPDLLLADEPTGNLDEQSAQQILDLLLQLAREQGAGMLLVTHAEQIAAAADRRLRLHLGRIEPCPG